MGITLDEPSRVPQLPVELSFDPNLEAEDMFDSAEKHAGDALKALQTLKLRTLQCRAESLAAHPLQIDAATDNDKPKEALIALILQQEQKVADIEAIFHKHGAGPDRDISRETLRKIFREAGADFSGEEQTALADKAYADAAAVQEKRRFLFWWTMGVLGHHPGGQTNRDVGTTTKVEQEKRCGGCEGKQRR